MSDTLSRTLRWRWALVVAVFLPSAVIAVTMVQLQSRSHEASSVIAMVPQSGQTADNDQIQLAVDRYSVRLQSVDVLLRVAVRTGVLLSTVRSGVSVTSTAGSANLRIVSTASTPREARTIAEAVAEEGVRLAGRDPTVDAQLLAPASAEAPPLTASPKVLQAVLVLTALAIALGLAYMLELLRPRVRTDEDVEDVADVPLLGTVPRLGKRAPLTAGHDNDGVLVAARELRQGFLAGGRDGRGATTTFVIGLDRGAGSSTVAWMLARSSSVQGESVVLVDADAGRAGLSEAFGLPAGLGLGDVLARPERLDDAIDDVHGVAVVGARPFPRSGSIRADQLGEVLKATGSRFDRVLVDVSPAQVPLVAETVSAQAADVLVVVGQGTPTAAVRTELARWTRLGLPIRGVVLNRRSPAAARRSSRVRRTRAPVVLMYHGFCTTRRDDDPENLFVEVGAFEQQLTWLRQHGWTPLDLDGYLEARAGRRPSRKTFLVTIDDGYPSVAELAAPVLTRLEVPALLFVPAGLVGQTAHWLPSPADTPIMTAEQLRRLQEDHAIEIGAHGWDHRDLRGLDADELERQVGEAGSELRRVLERPVRALAYPYGGHDRAARAAAERTGVPVAFSVFEDAGPFAVSRVDVNATDTARSFRLKLMPHYRGAWLALRRAPWIRRSVRRLTTGATRQRT